MRRHMLRSSYQQISHLIKILSLTDRTDANSYKLIDRVLHSAEQNSVVSFYARQSC